MKLQFLDKFGAIGAVIAAIGCPVCFPLIAVVGSTLGLGFLRPYEGLIMYVFQGLVVISLIGSVLTYLSRKKVFPLVVSVIGTGLVFYSFYVRFGEMLIYMGLFGVLLSAVINEIDKRRCKPCIK